MIRAIPVMTPLRRKRLLEVQKMMVPAAAKIPDATRKETREARLSPFTGEHWKARNCVWSSSRKCRPSP